MKKDVLKQLQSYSALVAGLIAADAAYGEIVYTDVNPDEDVLGDTTAVSYNSDECGYYEIDLDDDGNYDYTLKVRSDQAHGAGWLIPEGDNEYVNITNGNFAKPLDAGTYIGEDDTTEWKGLVVYPNGYNYLGTLTTYGVSAADGGGGMTGKTDKYLGLKFYIGSSAHYGWLRMDVRNDSRIYTVKDFAYESTADESIIAGDTATTVADTATTDTTDTTTSIVENNLFSSVKVYTSGSQLNIQLSNDIDPDAEVKMYNLSGTEIFADRIKSAESSFNINASSGIYIVKIKLEEGILTKKIILE